MLFSAAKWAFLTATLCSFGLAGCVIARSDQLYLDDASAARQADDHLVTHAKIRCDGDCSADARHCVKVTWKDSASNHVVSADETCSDKALGAAELETLEVATAVAVPTGSSIVGAVELVDGDGRRIQSGESSLGATEDTEETLANP